VRLRCTPAWADSSAPSRSSCLPPFSFERLLPPFYPTTRFRVIYWASVAVSVQCNEIPEHGRDDFNWTASRLHLPHLLSTSTCGSLSAFVSAHRLSLLSSLCNRYACSRPLCLLAYGLGSCSPWINARAQTLTSSQALAAGSASTTTSGTASASQTSSVSPSSQTSSAPSSSVTAPPSSSHSGSSTHSGITVYGTSSADLTYVSFSSSNA
jgi:hypothetical protein